MTQPRRHIPGQVVHLNRRCFQRKFFLRPDSFINRVLFYETARYSKRHGQVVHGAMAMSNHLHQISTDTTADLTPASKRQSPLPRGGAVALRATEGAPDEQSPLNISRFLREAEDEIRKQRRKKKVLGRVRVCRTDPFSTPKTPSQMGTLRPRFATKDGELLSRAKNRHYQFQDAYQRQRVKWMAGKRATFPAGTVQLRRCAPIRCKPPDDDEPGIFELKRALG